MKYCSFLSWPLRHLSSLKLSSRIHYILTIAQFKKPTYHCPFTGGWDDCMFRRESRGVKSAPSGPSQKLQKCDLGLCIPLIIIIRQKDQGFVCCIKCAPSVLCTVTGRKHVDTAGTPTVMFPLLSAVAMVDGVVCEMSRVTKVRFVRTQIWRSWIRLKKTWATFIMCVFSCHGWVRFEIQCFFIILNDIKI